LGTGARRSSSASPSSRSTRPVVRILSGPGQGHRSLAWATDRSIRIADWDTAPETARRGPDEKAARKSLKKLVGWPITGATPQRVGRSWAQGRATSASTHAQMALLDTTPNLPLESAMRGSMMRQTLLTNKPGETRTPPATSPRTSTSRNALNEAVQSGQPVDQVQFEPLTENISVSADGNGVNAEQQVRLPGRGNGLLYQQLTQVAAAREGILKSAMGMA